MPGRRAGHARLAALLVAVVGIACTTEVVELRVRDASLAGDSETAGTGESADEGDSTEEIREDAATGAPRDSAADLLDTVDRPAWGEAGKVPDGVSRSVTGLARYVEYTCCRSDKVTGCLVDVLGGPTSCKNATIWKAYADQACRQRGLSMTDVSFYDECTDLSNGADGGVDAPCITLENHDSRCTICDQATVASNFYCEPLVCKPFVDGSTVCQECVWADHPGAPCTYCVDPTGVVLEDTCHTLVSAS